MAKTVSKIAYLDGIRGIASLLVVLHHFFLAFYIAYFSFDPGASNLRGLEIKYGQSVFSVLSNGHFCVCVFFVLSGFVLSRKYFQTNDFQVIVGTVLAHQLHQVTEFCDCKSCGRDLFAQRSHDELV